MSAVLKINRTIGVMVDNVDLVWEEVSELIDKAMVYSDGKITTQDLYHSIKNRDMQLWLVPGGVIVTRIVIYPRSKRLEAIAASGEWQDWNTYGQDIINWAKLHGCDAVELTGRPGWGRKTGFEEIHRTFRVRI